MQESQFHKWLIDKEYVERTISSRLSNCRRIEEFEGDLDDHFNKDSGVSLSDRLQYSTQDQKNGTQAKHSIPINGNIYNGTATFRSAANLYFKFKTKKTDTPKNKINEFEYDICKILTQLCYHIHPRIIRRIQEDNERQYEFFENLFSDYINIEDYLFAGSACVFPGVRRYVGGQGNKKQYNKELESPKFS